MNRLTTPFAILLLLAAAHAPSVRAEPDPAYPDELLALLPKWLGEARTLSYMTPAAESYLEKADAMAAQGRFRVALFDLDTHRQLAEAGRLVDETRDESLARQKDAILRTTAAWQEEARADWQDYRRELHALDGRLRSLHAAELALYSADLALTAAIQMEDADDARTAFSRVDDVDPALVAGLVRTTRGVSYQLALAGDVLEVAAGLEGLPPRLDESGWNATLAAARATPKPDDVAYLRPIENAAGDAQRNGEDLLALAAQLAAVRQARVAAILQQYGDAAARGEEVVRDAAGGVRKASENVTFAPARDAQLNGVFTADAKDQADYALSLADSVGLVTLAYVWAALDHQAAATALFQQAARPADAPAQGDVPGPGLALAAAALALAALASRRRR